MEDTGGFKIHAEGVPKKVIRLVRDDGQHRVVVMESITQYTWNGRKSNGISEYLHKIS